MRLFHQRAALALAGAAALGAAALAIPSVAHAQGAINFAQDIVGPFGGEPSLTTDSSGVLYDSSPSGPETFRGITDHSTGKTTWTPIQSPDTASGDTCVNTDAQNSLYWCNLNGTDAAPVQADVYKSTKATTCTTDCGWQGGSNATQTTVCQPGSGAGTSCNPFGVDRQWVASTIRPGHDTKTADVVLMYHDFYGPSHIWVNISHDGGSTFGTAQEVLSGSNFTQDAQGAITAEGYTFCNTIPIGVGIVPATALASQHPGRVIVSWLASDAAQDGTGCNLTQDSSYHTIWSAWSDDALTASTPTWNPQLAYDTCFDPTATAPTPSCGHDASTPFAAMAMDDQGNPYLAFDAPAPSSNSVTCTAEGNAGTLQSDPTCSYHTYIVWSKDGGSVWNGGGGDKFNPLLSGSAAQPIEAGPTNETGTDVFATIAAGDPGEVAVSWLHTATIDPTGAVSVGKFNPLGCDSADNTNGTPIANYPARCHWYLEATQTMSLPATPGAATWATPWVSNEMHYGDICNLGIACAQAATVNGNGIPRDPRHLLDFNMETIDPTTGCAHIAYADDNAGANYGDPGHTSAYGDHLVSADQTSGCFGPLGQTVSANTPESPLAIALIPVGLAVVLGSGIARRRRRSLSAPLS